MTTPADIADTRTSSAKRVTFYPSLRRSWFTGDDGVREIWLCGWVRYGGRVARRDDACEMIRSICAEDSLEAFLAQVDGHFAAVIIERDGSAILIADPVRSVPLAYAKVEDGWIVSDDVTQLRDATGRYQHSSVVQFAAAGLVSGGDTLYESVQSLQAAEIVTLRPGGSDGRRYFHYTVDGYTDRGRVGLQEELTDLFDQVFADVVRELNGRQVVVPLSGGLDSRLVAGMLKDHGYRDVVCLSYGRPGNPDSARAKDIAGRLGYPWRFVPYTSGMWRSELGGRDLSEYWKFASNGVSEPHCDDWLALRWVRERGRLPEDAVFLPGHTGDFICGSHLKYLLDPVWNDDPTDLTGAIVRKHYSLWEEIPARASLRAILDASVLATTARGPDSTIDSLSTAYEAWEWQERQAKFIVNAVRSYEWRGFDWQLPLWDRRLMAFWRRVPPRLKVNKALYRSFLRSRNPGKVFSDVRPGPVWERPISGGASKASLRSRVRARLLGLPGVGSARQYKARVRKHFDEYVHHPLGAARAYGILYPFSNPGKRHFQSLILRSVVEDTYGIRFSSILGGEDLSGYRAL